MISHGQVAKNRKAFHDYSIEDRLEAGIVLTGSEVKSLRQGRASLSDSYAIDKQGELWLINVHIPEFAGANQFNHVPKRERKLLVHRRELARLIGQVRRGGMTLVPLAIYFNKHGKAKVELGLGRGKRKIDKRETVKQRDWQREKARLMRDKG